MEVSFAAFIGVEYLKPQYNFSYTVMVGYTDPARAHRSYRKLGLQKLQRLTLPSMVSGFAVFGVHDVLSY